MQNRLRNVDVDRYLPHAVMATVVVFGLPLVAVYGVVAWTEPDPGPVVTGLMSAGLALAVTVAGSAFWMRRPQSADITFGELMLWGWIRRRRAERTLSEGARMLGLDRSIATAETLRPPDRLELLRELNAALESKDPYTHGHSRRVERHAYRTALAMGLSVRELEDLRNAAALHDVGKIQVPERIIRKPGALTPQERRTMEQHAAVGAWMVVGIGSREMAQAIRHHHERWDGAGYPDGLAGAEIPLFARVIAVADAYDAMTSSRPYRASLGREIGMQTLKGESGTQFDPRVVDAFLSTLPKPAVIPVAGVLIFWQQSSRAVRNVAAAFRRAGATSAASAAGAAGTAVVLGMSALSTPWSGAPQTGSAQEVARAPQSGGETEGVATAGGAASRSSRSSTQPASRRLSDEVSERPAPAARVRARAARPASVAVPDPGRTEASQQSSGPAPSHASGGPEEPPREVASDGRASPERQRRGRGPARAPSDPRPDRGRDCDEHGRDDGAGRQLGNERHCSGD